MDDTRLQRCAEIWSAPFGESYLPRFPGPFKRAGAFAVAAQYYSPFCWHNSLGKELSIEELACWEPRLIIWTLPQLAATVTQVQLPPIIFPTLHVQLEVLAYLRNLHRSVRAEMPRIDVGILADRVTQLSLTFEASAYASYPDTSRLQPFARLAADCVHSFSSLADPLAPDRFFLNLDYYNDIPDAY